MKTRHGLSAESNAKGILPYGASIFRNAHLLKRSLTVLICMLALACVLGSEMPKEVAGAPICPDVSTIIEILDAVQAELLVSGTCTGGERLDLYIASSSCGNRLVDLYYRIPGKFCIARECYIQENGLALLADDLAFADSQTRYSLYHLDEKDWPPKCKNTVVLHASLGQGLTKDQLARQNLREELKKAQLRQP